MEQLSDVKLLQDWREQGDRQAIDQLIRKHIDFVYGAARRQVGNAHLAEDVTQAVFMLLMHKSPRISSEAALGVWLHRTARFASANARRMVQRQAQRERRAARPEAQEIPMDASQEYRELLPILDDAIERLPARDRSGVIMCYFQQCNYRRVGESLGISEEAARKRVSRAVDRMREYFTQRGVITTSAALATCLVAESSIAAPVALASATANLATLSQIASFSAGASSAPAATIMKGVIQTMLLSKLKLAAAACAAIVFGGAVTGAAIHQILLPATAIVATSVATNLAPPYRTSVADNMEVEFLGLAKWGSDEWFSIDGAKIEDPRGPFANEQLRARPQTTHQAVLHVSGPKLNGGYSVKIQQASFANLLDLTPSADEAFLLVPFAVPKDQKTIDIELLLSDGEWKTVVTAEHQPGRPLGSHDTEFGGVAFTHISEGESGGSMVYVAYEVKGPQFEVVAIDANGAEHRAQNITGGKAGGFFAMRYDFALPPEQITGLVAKVRPFNKKVTAKNVTLDPSHRTQPQITVEEIPEKK